MLIALDWIKEQLMAIYDAVSGSLAQLSFETITNTLTGFMPLTLFCLAAALVLCFGGFRVHKWISGFAGGMMLAWLGWHLGQFVDNRALSIAILLAIIFGVVGFFVLYVVYQISVVLAVFLLAYGSFMSISTGENFTVMALALSLVLSIAFCVLYVMNKVIMTSLTGSILLFLLLSVYEFMLAAVVCAITFAAGIYVQMIFMHKAEDKRMLEEEEYRKKYLDNPHSAKLQLAKLEKRRELQ